MFDFAEGIISCQCAEADSVVEKRRISLNKIIERFFTVEHPRYWADLPIGSSQ